MRKTYFVGYQQLFLSRRLRRIIATNELHRAWLSGNQANIGETDGVLYRQWFTNRKTHTNATIKQLLVSVLHVIELISRNTNRSDKSIVKRLKKNWILESL